MKVKIEKTSELSDAVVPNNIPTGFSTTLEVSSIDLPVVGECFRIGYFRTSTVMEIIDANTIKTMNSVYRWEIIES